jgi:hypothetical protein
MPHDVAITADARRYGSAATMQTLQTLRDARTRRQQRASGDALRAAYYAATYAPQRMFDVLPLRAR